MNFPSWLIKKTPKSQNIKKLRLIINDPKIHTVCEEAKCPNIGECYSNKSLTFLILGDTCTRNCSFCAVKNGKPKPPDPTEPKRIADAAKKLGLKYVVVTSVTRDDLKDGGAEQFVKTILELQKEECKVEVLIPDFKGNKESLKKVVDASPKVLNHNIETIPRFYPIIRPKSGYLRSLILLARAKEIKQNICTKSGLMVGLGETEEEVIKTLKDLRTFWVDVVTIGQYIKPSKDCVNIVEYVKPEKFEKYKNIALELGFKYVESGPFVRSSYKAYKILERV